MRRPALLTLLLLLPGCGLLDRAAPPPEPVVLERAWVRDDLTAVSRATAVGDRVVLYTATAGQLMLTALDPADGRTVWSVPTTPASVTDGVDLSVHAVDGLVVHTRPGPGQTGVVTALEASTGRQRWTDTVAVAYQDQPGSCDDDEEEGGVCGTGVTTDGRAVDVRWRAADGRRTQTARARDEQAGRGLGADVRDAGPRDPELLERREDGRVVWQRPAEEVFGAAVSSDQGWYLDRFEEVVVGMLGRRRAQVPEDQPLVLDFSKDVVTAGFSYDDGAPLWSEPGTFFRCNSAFDDVLVDLEGLAYRCRYRGTVTYDGPTGSARVSPGFTTSLEGFDPRTGATRWTVDLTGLPASGLEGEGSVLGLDGHRLVLSDGRGRSLLVDLDDGSTRDAAPDTTGWCTVQGGPVQLDEDGSRSRRGTTADHAVPCRADGAPTRVPPSLDADRGVVVGDVVAWTTNAGVRAARQTSGPRPRPRPSATGTSAASG